jgi:hypothetical protein
MRSVSARCYGDLKLRDGGSRGVCREDCGVDLSLRARGGTWWMCLEVW